MTEGDKNTYYPILISLWYLGIKAFSSMGAEKVGFN